MRSRDWWLDFFDDAYRFIFGDMLDWARTEAELQALRKLLALQPGQRVLDLCCGDGRHSVGLARGGFLVVGVDSSAVMLRRAKERAAQQLPVDPETGEQAAARAG